MMEKRMQMDQTPSGREMADIAVANGAIDMAQGVVHTTPPQLFHKILEELWDTRRLHVYASPSGYSQYREVLTALLARERPDVTVDQIMASHGVTGGLVAALRATCEAGDAVALFEPFYPAHAWAVTSLFLTPQYVPWSSDFTIDFDALERVLPQVRVFLLANPANPTGTVLGKDELQRIYDLCVRHDVLLVVDEVYRDFVWEGSFTSPLAFAERLEYVVVLRSFSKNLALAGWRVGYTISNAERIAEMTHVHDALYVGAPSAPQMVMARLLSRHPDSVNSFIVQLTGDYAERRQEIIEAFTGFGMQPKPKQGAYYMMIQHNREGDMQAMQELLKLGIAVAPGKSFYRPNSPDSGYIRVHFALSEADSREVAKRLTNGSRT